MKRTLIEIGIRYRNPESLGIEGHIEIGRTGRTRSECSCRSRCCETSQTQSWPWKCIKYTLTSDYTNWWDSVCIAGLVNNLRTSGQFKCKCLSTKARLMEEKTVNQQCGNRATTVHNRQWHEWTGNRDCREGNIETSEEEGWVWKVIWE